MNGRADGGGIAGEGGCEGVSRAEFQDYRLTAVGITIIGNSERGRFQPQPFFIKRFTQQPLQLSALHIGQFGIELNVEAYFGLDGGDFIGAAAA